MSQENISSLRELHYAICCLVEYFDDFCSKHGITYYLMGGSALGAIRHKGFIPWDDDFDVFMDYQNYCNFLSCARKKFNTPLYLDEESSPGNPFYFTKIRLDGTKYIEIDQDPNIPHQGIFLDVMCLNDVSECDLVRRSQYLVAKALCAYALTQKPYTTRSMKKKLALNFSKVLRFKIVRELALSFVRKNNRKGSKVVAHFFGRAPYKKTFFPKAVLGTPTRVKFESLILPIPERSNLYLSARFGPNFMKLPDDLEREKFPSHLIKFDAGKYKKG